ncbi:MAG: hypothetical protein ABJO38_21195 [Stappiaceae bacterium]
MRLSMTASIFTLCFMISGCVPTTSRVAYDHATASQQQMYSDRAECAEQAKGITPTTSGGKTGINDGIWENCLAGKGYTRNNSTGRLEVPANLQVTTY